MLITHDRLPHSVYVIKVILSNALRTSRCPRLPNDHGPMPLEDLKTFITPTAAELKKATEGADITFEDLGHPAMLTIRRAGDVPSGKQETAGTRAATRQIRNRDTGAPTDAKPTNAMATEMRVPSPMNCDESDLWLELVPVLARAVTDSRKEPFYGNVTEKYVKSVVDKDANKHIKTTSGTDVWIEGQARGQTEPSTTMNQGPTQNFVSTTAVTTTSLTPSTIGWVLRCLSATRCKGCNWVFFCCKTHQELRSLHNQEFLAPCGIGSIRGQPGTQYQLPSRPTILEAPPATRPSNYQLSRVQNKREQQAIALRASQTDTGAVADKVHQWQQVVAFFVAQTGRSVKQIRCDGEFATNKMQEFCTDNGRKPPVGFLQPIGCLAWVRLWKSSKGMSVAVPGVLVGYNLFRRLYRIHLVNERQIVEQRNARFNPVVRGYTASVGEYAWDENSSFDDVQKQILRQPNEDFGANSAEFPYENSEATVKKDESFDSTIVVTEHDAANYREDNMPRNQRNQIPRLEAVPEATPLQNAPKAPRDIEGNISSSNIVTGARNRRQTPANVSTHMAVDNGGSDGDVMSDGDDELRYTDVCLFTRVLRNQKRCWQIPDVVQARTKKVEGLYDVACLEWATWSDADKDKIKAIRTGFVDAIKAGRRWDPASQFPPSFADDVRGGSNIQKGRGGVLLNAVSEDRGFANAKPAKTPCTDQEPQPADEAATLRQWPLRKLAGYVFICIKSRTLPTG
eukprot:g21671.t1